jgi:hypothetical protein
LTESFDLGAAGLLSAGAFAAVGALSAVVGHSGGSAAHAPAAMLPSDSIVM